MIEFIESSYGLRAIQDGDLQELGVLDNDHGYDFEINGRCISSLDLRAIADKLDELNGEIV